MWVDLKELKNISLPPNASSPRDHLKTLINHPRIQPKVMTQETPALQPEPTPDRAPIATSDDDGNACSLEGSGLGLFLNIMRISQHWGRPAFYEDLDEKMQAEVRLWAKAELTEEGDPVAHKVRAFCKKMLDKFEEYDGET
jgi:hypothetical protein